MCFYYLFNRRYILQCKIVEYELNIQCFQTKGSGNIVDKEVRIVFGLEDWSVWYEIVFLSNVRSYTIYFHEHYCLNVSLTRTKTMNMPQWMGESPWEFNTIQRALDNWGKLGLGKLVLPMEEYPQVVQCKTISSDNIYTNNILYTELVIIYIWRGGYIGGFRWRKGKGRKLLSQQ